MAVLGNPDMLTRKIQLCHINAHITCRLCDGYLIDATTVTECLHTFCRSCLVKYLEENNTCPTCRIVIHQSHPLQYIGHDRTMQDIVYKLVPGLQEAEMKKQREFYQKLGMEVPGDIKGDHCNMKTHLDQRNGDAKSEVTANKEAGEEKPEEENDYHRSDEQVSICLECNSSKLRGLKRKWIRCSAQATVLHLKKFIAKKLNLTSFNEVRRTMGNWKTTARCSFRFKHTKIHRIKKLIQEKTFVFLPSSSQNYTPTELQFSAC
ncbi:polycomb group RING finger protein 3 isoform X1 [Anarrhichthys ocellatus]|uniref:polycomb group RING finger protein 3 isoform X1 n=1 Tax=Anarrhichthys ocellatus TaxID=433405 RepID=UPI0012EDA6CA|nr:polycomb group RING finger protein 3 isoform X1 [Anarrhichthys ocellatus]